MKTIEDLKNVLPSLIEQFRESDHEIGSRYAGYDEDGYGMHDGYEDNYLCYERDGWVIEINYAICGSWDYEYGELLGTWGNVTDLYVYHCDDEIGEETIFDNDQLDFLRESIENEIRDIAA